MLNLTRMAFSLVFLGVVAIAADKPDLSGTWKINKSKSELGPVADRMLSTETTYVFEHTDPELKTVGPGTRGGTQSMKYTTDGKESLNNVGGSEAKSVAKWEGSTLTIATTREIQGASITTNDRFTLSDDKKTLLLDRKMKSPIGEFTMKMVLDRQ